MVFLEKRCILDQGTAIVGMVFEAKKFGAWKDGFVNIEILSGIPAGFEQTQTKQETAGQYTWEFMIL